jgi:hypothetical protein
MNIRILRVEDTYAFRRLRLEGAKEFSGAFDPTEEEEEQQSPAKNETKNRKLSRKAS